MLALIQLGFSVLLKNDRYQRFIGIPKYLPGTILEKLVTLFEIFFFLKFKEENFNYIYYLE